MKIVKTNAGAFTNFEVLDLLNSRGASNDTTRFIAPIAKSEYKVYDYLMETAASTQTREGVNEFAEKCKDFKLAKAEILNIINLRPSSDVNLNSIIERNPGPDTRDDVNNLKSRGINLNGILKLVEDLLPPLPATDQENDQEETENGEES
uniref:DNA-directed RNA polymerase III subunit RPC9 n=1 Tax=Noccaea caerulescens TaxID=107243 RepID=A0A1J3DYY5_NOCCA